MTSPVVVVGGGAVVGVAGETAGSSEKQATTGPRMGMGMGLDKPKRRRDRIDTTSWFLLKKRRKWMPGFKILYHRSRLASDKRNIIHREDLPPVEVLPATIHALVYQPSLDLSSSSDMKHTEVPNMAIVVCDQEHKSVMGSSIGIEALRVVSVAFEPKTTHYRRIMAQPDVNEEDKKIAEAEYKEALAEIEQTRVKQPRHYSLWNIRHIILVTPTDLTPQALKVVHERTDAIVSAFTWEFHLLMRWTMAPAHEEAPTFTLIQSDAEVQRYLVEHDLTIKDLGEVSMGDPLVKLYGFQPGQVIKYIYTSRSAGFASKLIRVKP